LLKDARIAIVRGTLLMALLAMQSNGRQKRLFGLAIFVFTLTTGTFGSSAATGNETDESPLRQRFVSEYPAASKRLRDPLRNVHVKGRLSRDQEYDARCEFYVLDGAGQSVLEFETRNDRYPATRVFSRSDQTAFELGRPTANSSYVVTQLWTSPDNSRVIDKQLSSVGRYIFAASQLYAIPLSDVIADTRNVIQNVTEVIRGERPCIRVDLALDPKSVGYEVGYAILDPELNWAIAEYEVAFVDEEHGEKHRISEFGVVENALWGEAGIVFPRSVTIYDRNEGPAKRLERKFSATFTDLELGGVTPAQFQLSAFNVDEIPLRGPAARFLSIGWIVTLNLIALAILVAYFSRRQPGRRR